jgi:hypothetical protein
MIKSQIKENLATKTERLISEFMACHGESDWDWVTTSE